MREFECDSLRFIATEVLGPVSTTPSPTVSQNCGTNTITYIYVVLIPDIVKNISLSAVLVSLLCNS